MDLIDKKILLELDKNSRIPITKLAKKLKANRNTVEYRINQLVEAGIIKQFVTIFNPLVFEKQLYKIYLQLQDLSEEKEKEIIKFLQSLPVYWLAKSYGKWDFLVGLQASSPKEFNQLKLKILSKLEGHIVNKDVTLMVNAPFFARDYILGNKTHTEIKSFLNEVKINIDEKDKQILKLLSTNSRYKVIDLAKKLNITTKTVIQRIKRLEKHNIIINYRISLNLEKIGHKFMKAFISLKNVTEKDHKQFINYCIKIPNLIHLIETIGAWDFEPEFEIKNEQEFYHVLNELRSKFSKIIKTIDVATIVKEYEYKVY